MFVFEVMFGYIFIAIFLIGYDNIVVTKLRSCKNTLNWARNSSQTNMHVKKKLKEINLHCFEKNE